MVELIQDRSYRVGLAILEMEGLFQDVLREALVASWTTGATVTRYGRRWTLSRIHGMSETEIIGEIGFVAENEVTTLFFDYDKGEFVRGGAPTGVLVPFAVRLSDGLIAFQLRSGVIREATFTGALEALLNITPHEYVWRVRSAVVSKTWEEWRSEVETVTAFSFRLDRPNPHYDDDWRIEDLIENIHLQYATLAGRALEGESVNTDDDLFRQAVDHVIREYGRGAVDGVTLQGRESTWIKVKGLAASVRARLSVQAVGTEEIPEEALVEVLQSQPTGQLGADLGSLNGLENDPLAGP